MYNNSLCNEIVTFDYNEIVIQNRGLWLALSMRI